MPELVVLGSGCFTPPPRGVRASVRNPAGYALVVGREILLLDFGFGNLRQMARAGLDPSRVSAAFFSHFHPDHLGDLAALLFYFRYDRKPRLGGLDLFGPRGFVAFFRRLSRAHGEFVRPAGYRLATRDLASGDEAHSPRGNWRVACRAVPHSGASLAYRVEAGGKALCYTGDTGPDPGLALFGLRADLFIAECTLADGDRFRRHLTVSQALRLVRESGCRTGILSHLSPASERELARRLKSRNGPIRAARDLMRVRW